MLVALSAIFELVGQTAEAISLVSLLLHSDAKQLVLRPQRGGQVAVGLTSRHTVSVCGVPDRKNEHAAIRTAVEGA